MPIRIPTSSYLSALFASFAAGRQLMDPLPAQITSGPNLARRQTGAAQTCGYVSGQANSPLTCGSGYSCTIDGDADNFFACCDSFNSCTSDWHTCANWGEPTLGAICSSIYTQCLNCGADAPFCATYKRYLSTGATSPLTSLFCAPASTVITALVHANQAVVETSAASTLESSATSALALSGAPSPQTSSAASSTAAPTSSSPPVPSSSSTTPSSSTPSKSSSPSTSSSSSTTTTSSLSSAISTSTTSTSSSSIESSSGASTYAQTSVPTPSPTLSPTSSHKLKAGAIAGITLGAIFGSIILALIIWGLIWCCRKCRRDRQRKSTPAPDPAFEMSHLSHHNAPLSDPVYTQSNNSAIASNPPPYPGAAGWDSRRQSALTGSSGPLPPVRIYNG